ncbi:hypothetical protein ACGIF2_13690 [Cellulomonas sp. P22]|uniref:hypothetical protein n=1 Tax=Cellulomonas sp. P22 TaxID=3373189 RepID=UPI0037939E20
MTSTRPRALLVAPIVLTFLLAGCSGDSAGTATSAAATPAGDQPQQGAGGMPGGGMQGGGGTTGEIAYVSGALMQVQGDDGQTAVTWTDATTFSRIATGSLADVAVGSCVVAFTAGDPSDAVTSVATSVQVTAAVDGECTSGFGGMGGMGGGAPGGDGAGRPDGAPTDMPSGMPTDMPGGMPTDVPSGMPTGGTGGQGAPGGGFGGATSGLVTAVDGTTLTLTTTTQDGTAATATVTVDDATTYTTTSAADSTAAVVGLCATARGEADSSGQVAATSITVSDPGDDGCTSGFGGMMGGGPGGPRGDDGQTSTKGSGDA